MRKKFMSKTLAGVLAAALAVTSFLPAFAANVDGTNNLTNQDVIDVTRNASLTITKYDITAATEAGVYTEGTSRATGEEDSDLQTTMEDYAIQGVVFSYLKVGDIEQYSYTDPTSGETTLKVVYEIPTTLADILGLDDANNTKADGTENDAVDMTASGIAAESYCNKAGYLHYTSDQINDALSALLATGTAGKNALEDYMKNYGGTAMTETNQYGVTTATDLDLGLYLIVETSVPENVTDTVNPFFASLPMTNLAETAGGTEGGQSWLYNVYVYPKNDTGNPTLDKMVRNATGVAATAIANSEDMSYIVSNLTDDYATYGSLGTQTAEAFAKQRGDGEYTTESTTDEYTYASTTTASTKDILDYILVSKLPTITSNATAIATYTFEDILSAGLTYNSDMKIAFYEAAEDANLNNTVNAIAIWTLDDATKYFDVEVTSAATTTLTVTMTEEGLKVINGVDANGDTVPADSYTDKYMVVYYSGTVNADGTTVLGDNGNDNNVTLTWERTSTGYADTLKDKSIVYVYGIDLTKTFTGSYTGDYSEVDFVLYNRTDGYYLIAEETANGSGLYYVTGKTTSEDNATKFSPSDAGSMIIYGLEADTYGLTEVGTADGYNLLSDDVTIVINAKSDKITAEVAHYTGTEKTAMSESTLVNASATVDGETSTLTASNGSSNAVVKLGVVNTQEFELPLTGGAGLYAVTIIGVITIAAGLYFFFGRRSQKKEAKAQ